MSSSSEADAAYALLEEELPPLERLIDPQTEVSIKMFLSGGISGAVSKTVTAPFARLTILYQTHGFASMRETPSLDRALIHVVRSEGMQALWKGNMATVLHRLPYSAASFLTYEQSLSLLHTFLPKEEHVVTGTSDVIRRFLAGAFAGGVSTVVAYPIDLVRTRLAAQTNRHYKGDIASMYYANDELGIWDVLNRTYQEERLVGLYKGLGGSLMQVVPNVSINLCAYETLRSYWISHSQSTSPGLLGSVVCGGTSAVVSASMTYPIDLIRRRMQLQGQHGTSRTYHSYVDAIQKTWKSGGWRAFYMGISAEYIKVIPGVAIIYSVYEFSKKSFGVDGFNIGRR